METTACKANCKHVALANLALHPITRCYHLVNLTASSSQLWKLHDHDNSCSGFPTMMCGYKQSYRHRRPKTTSWQLSPRQRNKCRQLPVRRNLVQIRSCENWAKFSILIRSWVTTFMADRLSVWLVHLPAIPCRTTCEIRLLAGTVSDNLWRCFCLQRTDAFSALEVSWRCAM